MSQLNRAKILPIDLNVENIKANRSLNKLQIEQQNLNQSYYNNVQLMQTKNSKEIIDLIGPEQDIRSLRLKNDLLDKARGIRPSQKQYIDQHVKTLYDQESKYLGERAEFYRTQIYNPYLLKGNIESTKNKNLEHRESDNKQSETLFEHEVFDNHENKNRSLAEKILIEPLLSATQLNQEDKFILKQTTYGDSYNVKKFLQEHELVNFNAENEPIYRRLDSQILNYQNITLKSKLEELALRDYLNGSTTKIDVNRIRNILEKHESQTNKIKCPRLVGPIAPEPYESIFCTKDISEMSDGFSKRNHLRLYQSPFILKQKKYFPLENDLRLMHDYEQYATNRAREEEIYLENLNKKIYKQHSNKPLLEFKTNENKLVATQKITKDQLENKKSFLTTYNLSYLPYGYQKRDKCSYSEYNKPIPTEYSIEPSRSFLAQNNWSRTLASKRFYEEYNTK